MKDVKYQKVLLVKTTISMKVQKIDFFQCFPSQKASSFQICICLFGIGKETYEWRMNVNLRAFFPLKNNPICFLFQSSLLPPYCRSHGHALPAEGVEPTAQQSHPRDSARTSRPAAETAALAREGGGTVQVFQPK